jgi:hypothetical protein
MLLFIACIASIAWWYSFFCLSSHPSCQKYAEIVPIFIFWLMSIFYHLTFIFELFLSPFSLVNLQFTVSAAHENSIDDALWKILQRNFILKGIILFIWQKSEWSGWRMRVRFVNKSSARKLKMQLILKGFETLKR